MSEPKTPDPEIDESWIEELLHNQPDHSIQHINDYVKSTLPDEE